MVERVCENSKCGKLFTVARAGGVPQKYCSKVCRHRVIARRYYKAHSEDQYASKLAWMRANPEKVKAQQQRKRRRHPELWQKTALRRAQAALARQILKITREFHKDA